MTKPDSEKDIIIDWDFETLAQRAKEATDKGFSDPLLELALKAMNGEISNREYWAKCDQLSNEAQD